jgi:hypothetical protein
VDGGEMMEERGPRREGRGEMLKEGWWRPKEGKVYSVR